MNSSSMVQGYESLTIWEKFAMIPIEFYLFMFMVPIVIGLVVVFYLVKTAGGKDTTNYSTYAPSGGRILAARDRYTHTTETRTRIKQNNGGGGGHGGGRPGGGRPGGGGHRGGGRGGR